MRRAVTDARLPRRIWIALAVFALLMLGLLSAQLAVLGSQKATAERQLSKQPSSSTPHAR